MHIHKNNKKKQLFFKEIGNMLTCTAKCKQQFNNKTALTH